MAMAARFERGMLDPDSAPGTSVFDRHIYVLASDGDIQEGISAEASSIAGTQELGNLTVIWDDNRINIEGDTAITFTEDSVARYQAYGWHTEVVGLAPNGDVDIDALDAALARCRAQHERPSFIALRTIIGWPAPTKQNTGDVHGAKLGAGEVAAVKGILGFDPDQHFVVEQAVLEHARAVADRGAVTRAKWEPRFQAWGEAHPERAALLDRIVRRGLPEDLASIVPAFEVGASMATRAASGLTINHLADTLPEFWGGSADLAGSNNTTITILHN